MTCVYRLAEDAYTRRRLSKPIRVTDVPQLSLKPILRISFSGQDRLGRGKIELLEHIRETGSISAAGRAMDMSYRRAWMLISELNHMFREPVVESQRGGQKGGGAALTAFGEELLNRFRDMEKSMREALANDLDWLEANRSHNEDRRVDS